jgi:hypothetical protein
MTVGNPPPRDLAHSASAPYLEPRAAVRINLPNCNAATCCLGLVWRAGLWQRSHALLEATLFLAATLVAFAVGARLGARAIGASSHGGIPPTARLRANGANGA